MPNLLLPVEDLSTGGFWEEAEGCGFMARFKLYADFCPAVCSCFDDLRAASNDFLALRDSPELTRDFFSPFDELADIQHYGPE